MEGLRRRGVERTLPSTATTSLAGIPRSGQSSFAYRGFIEHLIKLLLMLQL